MALWWIGLDSSVKRCIFLWNSKLFTTRLPLFLSRLPFTRKLFFKIIISLYYKTSSNKNKIFQKNIFPYCINKWNYINKLKVEVRNAKSMNIFKKFSWCQKEEISLFFIYDPNGAKLLTCLRLQFSPLNKHGFGYGFSNIVNLMCAWVTEIETTKHFLSCCHFYSTQAYSFLKSWESQTKLSKFNCKKPSFHFSKPKISIKTFLKM